MILEQAFFALPEFLVGTGFTKYDAEGTLVMAYAMAVLQELNGRNISNPVALISGEKSYLTTANRTADLYLNYDPVGTLNSSLATFGVRKESWLEAKFFRKKKDGKPTLARTNGSYALLRDLLRLCVFPPQTVGCPPSAGRYLLHAYEDKPEDHLALYRNVKGSRQARGWLKGIHRAGLQRIKIGDLKPEPTKSFNKEIGNNLRNLDARLMVTTFSLAYPGSAYQLYLTRLDTFVVTRGAQKIELRDDSSAESSIGYWEQLRRDLDVELVT